MKLKLRVVLVDKDLNQKPVPRFSVVFHPLGTSGNGDDTRIQTDFDGTSEAGLAPGGYEFSAVQPIDFQGKRYSWKGSFTVTMAQPQQALILSNDNAVISEGDAEPSGRVTDELTTIFKRYEGCVVTVWSEVGHGTGFIFDPNGLILTNQHVIGPSRYIAVQFDETHKVAATLLAADPEKDIAVLWVNPSAMPNAIVAPLPQLNPNGPPAVEGERVFTIGSPLSQRKILTTGIVSKVEQGVIISDININPGNSGGPLFNSLGVVVGLTTFGEQERSGPGISGIVRIEQAYPLFTQAHAKMRDLPVPSATLLPVEPDGSFPLAAIKASLEEQKFDERPYIFREGDYDIAVITPILTYHMQQGGEVAAAREKEKRNKKKEQAVKETFQPLDDLKQWEEYTGQYKPVIIVRASPVLRETFGSALGRALSPQYAAPAKLRFKTDFYEMKLICGDKEIAPIQPGKIADVLNEQNRFVNMTDATYEGYYSYPYDAISPLCGKVSLEIFSEKDPAKPTIKVLDQKTVERVWMDFEPYRQAHGGS